MVKESDRYHDIHHSSFPEQSHRSPWRPTSQGWKTFLRNHTAGIASIDLFVVRTICFKLLYSCGRAY
jgi:hypothetical protein